MLDMAYALVVWFTRPVELYNLKTNESPFVSDTVTFTKIKVDYKDKKLPIEFNESKKFKTTYLDFDKDTNVGPTLTNNKTLNNESILISKYKIDAPKSSKFSRAFGAFPP